MAKHDQVLESRRVELEVEVRYRGESTTETVTAQTRNLSLSGLFIATPSPEPVGSTVELELELSAVSPTVAAAAEVVWKRDRREGPKRPAGMGLRYLTLNEKGREAIRALVQPFEATEN